MCDTEGSYTMDEMKSPLHHECFNCFRGDHESDTNYKKQFWSTLKFLFHVFVVMLLLYCGAVVFAVLEDPEIQPPLNFERKENGTEVGTTARTQISSEGLPRKQEKDIAEVWKKLGEKHSINMSEYLSPRLREDIQEFFAPIFSTNQSNAQPPLHIISTQTSTAAPPHRNRHERNYIFAKWFYFVTISTTTIGYGGLHPHTSNGKLFYIFFSLVGISLMMTLLKSCGEIINAVVSRFNALVTRYAVRDGVCGDEAMSVVSLTLMFAVFMGVVVWHDNYIGETHPWSVVDTVYFWIVTFTTVGFGDVSFSLDVEVDHLYVLLFLRIIGLSFLAAIIDAMQKYVKFKQQELARRSSKQLNAIKKILMEHTLAVF